MFTRTTFAWCIHGYKVSPFGHRVEIALMESGATYTPCRFNIHNKPGWFARVNPITGQVPAITYGGPVVPPEEPSELSYKLAESNVSLEFLADVYSDSSLLPPVSDPAGRARVQYFVDTTARTLDTLTLDLTLGNSNVNDKIIVGLEKVQALLPDPDAADGGEYAIGKTFTIADCSIAPILAFLDVVGKTDMGWFGPGTGTRLGEAMGAPKCDRLRYKKALWARESVSKVADLDALEHALRTMLDK